MRNAAAMTTTMMMTKVGVGKLVLFSGAGVGEGMVD
jgi:hypothetical protein